MSKKYPPLIAGTSKMNGAATSTLNNAPLNAIVYTLFIQISVIQIYGFLNDSPNLPNISIFLSLSTLFTGKLFEK